MMPHSKKGFFWLAGPFVRNFHVLLVHVWVIQLPPTIQRD